MYYFFENGKRDYVYVYFIIEMFYYILFVLDIWFEEKMVILKVYENYFFRLLSVG